jgi:hypothetical protein
MKLKVILLVGIVLILVSIMFGFFYLVRMHEPKEPKNDKIKTVSGIENTRAINNSEPAKVEVVKQKMIVEESNTVSSNPEVFHIRDNIFRQDQAAAVCKAFDAELASQSQLEDAFKKGADWCSYGWSKDGLALYPTQLDTFKKLQKNPGRESECGVPGVNGGFFDNKNLLFGVNCYGPKPVMKEGQVLNNELLTPTDREALKIGANKDEFEISPFSYSLWSVEAKKINQKYNNSANSKVNNATNDLNINSNNVDEVAEVAEANKE